MMEHDDGTCCELNLALMFCVALFLCLFIFWGGGGGGGQVERSADRLGAPTLAKWDLGAGAYRWPEHLFVVRT